MLKQSIILLALISCGWQAALADTIQLKDKASISGKILAEKRDQVVLDIGYTVLVIPRNQIVKVLKAKDAEPATMVASLTPIVPAPVKEPTETRVGSYQMANTPPPIKDVREL